MKHVSYGLFEDTSRAQAALDRIESSHTPGERCGVVLHEGHLDEGRLSMAETDAAEGFREGAAIGAVFGATAGAMVAGPLGLVPGAALGAGYGSVAGVIAGSAGPDRTLERLSKELAAGKVLLVVEAPSLMGRDKADAVMRSYGGHVEHRPLL